MGFNKAKLDRIRADIEQALEVVGQKHGLQLTCGHIKYGRSNFTLKLEASKINSDGTVETKEVSDFKHYCGLYGLSIDDLGKVFLSQGERFVLYGINPNAKSMPILGHKLGNPKAQYKFRRSVVSSIKSGSAPQSSTAHIDKSSLPPHILALLKKG
jgi:hypothetical protein